MFVCLFLVSAAATGTAGEEVEAVVVAAGETGATLPLAAAVVALAL